MTRYNDIKIEVKDYHMNTVEVITRVPKTHNTRGYKWESIIYKGMRYGVQGGKVCNYFIYLPNPLR